MTQLNKKEYLKEQYFKCFRERVIITNRCEYDINLPSIKNKTTWIIAHCYKQPDGSYEIKPAPSWWNSVVDVFKNCMGMRRFNFSGHIPTNGEIPLVKQIVSDNDIKGFIQGLLKEQGYE